MRSCVTGTPVQLQCPAKKPIVILYLEQFESQAWRIDDLPMPRTRLEDEMDCVVCQAHERDLADIQRRMKELAIDQKRTLTIAERDRIGLEIGALEAARAEFERKHLKHKKSQHQEPITWKGPRSFHQAT